MNEVQIFYHDMFGDIRAVAIDGEPWMVGKDIAAALGYSNTRDALSKRVDEEDKRQGSDYSLPTQYSMEHGWFEIKETAITHSDGHITVSKTPKVTGTGQVFFVNKLLAAFGKKEAMQV